MALSSLVPVLSTVLLYTSRAVVIHGDSLVRREGGPADSLSIQVTSKGISGQLLEEAAGTSTCQGCERYDYVLGVENKNECQHPELNETIVTAEDMCRFAATVAGAHADLAPTDFHIMDAGTFYHRNGLQATTPHGCFHKQCIPAGVAGSTASGKDETADKEHCYFINIGEKELSNDSHPLFAGTPICKREMYVDGGTDVQDGCPSEYKVIMDENVCAEQCDMDGYLCNEHFRIGEANYTQHHDYPQGCFHSGHKPLTSKGAPVTAHVSTEVHVYFNSVSDGTSVLGTPMCVVASPMNVSAWPAGAATTPAPAE